MTKKATSRHPWYTASGILARVFIFATKKMKEPTDLVPAAAFGIVELLGAKRFGQVVVKAVQQQWRRQFANTNAKAGAQTSPTYPPPSSEKAKSG